MKRIILFCLILFSLHVNAQVFGGPGSTWWIHAVAVNGMRVEKYEFKNDTAIQGRPYKNFTARGSLIGINVEPAEAYSMPNKTVYVSNDTVAIGMPDDLTLQLNFGADVGDSWDCGSGTIVVEAKFDTLLNGQTLRAMWLRKYMDTIPNYSPTLVIEKIGGGNFLPIQWQVIDSSMIGWFDDFVWGLHCFQSNELGFVQWGWEDTYAECESILPVNERQANMLTTYPNPVNNILIINGLKNQPFSYELYNAAGQIIRAEKATGNTVDLSSQTPGLYFIRISLANGYSQAVKVVKN